MKIKRLLSLGGIATVVTIATVLVVWRPLNPQHNDDARTVGRADTESQSLDQTNTSDDPGDAIEEKPPPQENSADSGPNEIVPNSDNIASSGPDDLLFPTGSGSPMELHARFERESRDESWATHTESRIANYVDRQPFGHTYSVSAECRETLCKVHADIDMTILELNRQSNPVNPNEDWQDLINRIRHESLGMDLETKSTGMAISADDPTRIRYLTILERSP